MLEADNPSSREGPKANSAIPLHLSPPVPQSQPPKTTTPVHFLSVLDTFCAHASEYACNRFLFSPNQNILYISSVPGFFPLVFCRSLHLAQIYSLMAV